MNGTALSMLDRCLSFWRLRCRRKGLWQGEERDDLKYLCDDDNKNPYDDDECDSAYEIDKTRCFE